MIFFILFFLVYLLMINSCNTLLCNDRAQTIPDDIGKIFKPKSVIDKNIEVDVAPIIKKLSTGSKIVFSVL